MLVLNDERIEEIKQRAQLFGASNGWAGTSGTLAAMIVELLNEIKRLKEQNANLQR